MRLLAVPSMGTDYGQRDCLQAGGDQHSTRLDCDPHPHPRDAAPSCRNVGARRPTSMQTWRREPTEYLENEMLTEKEKLQRWGGALKGRALRLGAERSRDCQHAHVGGRRIIVFLERLQVLTQRAGAACALPMMKLICGHSVAPRQLICSGEDTGAQGLPTGCAREHIAMVHVAA